MIFRETRLRGVYLIEPERVEDDRGFFARSFCQREFQRMGLEYRWVQCNISFNARKGTLRGMHYQAAPHQETKLLRCTLGAIFDVIIDLRTESPTYKQWEALELSAENRRLLYVPQGLAHGFLTLEDRSEVFYQMSEFYEPSSARGVRWDDLAFAIEWPATPQYISAKDRQYLPYTG